MDNIQSPSSPDFHPNNNKIYFTGIDNFESSVFSYDLKTRGTTKLTHGKLYVKSLNISSDGKKIVYSAKLPYSSYNLYLAPIETINNPKVLTDSIGDDITPSFSIDSTKIYYSSNDLEAYNLYSIDLKNKKKIQIY